MFAATPSDPSYDTPVIPGTGLCPSSRGSQSFADPAHPSCAAPGKRPRLTPMVAMAFLPDGSPMPLGTPGGDVQAQALAQVLLNIEVFGMNLQHAVEAPRFASYSFPDSFEPHAYSPGLLYVENRIASSVRDALDVARSRRRRVARFRVARRRRVRAARRSRERGDRGCRRSAAAVLRRRLVAFRDRWHR